MPRGKKSIPSLMSQGKDIFPVTPYRVLIDTTTPGTTGNEREVIDFDLQFEDNEVMDIVAVRYMMEFDLTVPSTQISDVAGLLALHEDPDKLEATDLSTEAEWEEDSGIIWMGKESFATDFITAASSQRFKTTYSELFIFPQPYTVARNVCLLLQMIGTEGDPTIILAHVEVWARRRKAPDSEFKNIIYRQRF